jgi:hypothetical protein
LTWNQTVSDLETKAHSNTKDLAASETFFKLKMNEFDDENDDEGLYNKPKRRTAHS